jgi:hypothetical protein
MPFYSKALPNGKKAFFSTKWIESMVLSAREHEPRVAVTTITGRVWHAKFKTYELAEEFVFQWSKEEGKEESLKRLLGVLLEDAPEIIEITDEPEVIPGERNG